MPLKPVFSVELNTDEFTRFKALYDRYQDSVTKLPKGWEAIAAAAKKVGQSTANMTGDLEEQIRLIMQKVELEGKEADNLDKADSKWKSIFKSVQSTDKSLEKGLFNLGKFGLKATAVLGGLGAIGLGASLFGIDRLSAMITTTRRQSSGVGTSFGEYRSFGTNYSRLINPTGLLDSAATAKYDVTSPEYTAFMSAGVSQNKLKNGTTAEIASDILDKLPKLFANVAPQFRGSYAKAYGIDQIMPMNDLNAFLNADPKERAKISQDTIKDAQDMDLNKETQRAWVEFTTQLDRATKTIEADLMEKLTPLEPGLEKLSKSFVNLIDAFAKSNEAESAIDWLAFEFDWLSKKFDDKTFRDDLSNWFTWIGDSSKSLLAWVSSFSAIAPASASELGTPNGSASGQSGDYVDAAGNIVRGGSVDAAGNIVRGGGGGSVAQTFNPYTGDYKDVPNAGNLTKLITQASKEQGIDPRIMEGIRAGESLHGSKYDFKDDAVESSWGPFELNRRRGLGVSFEKDTGLDVRDPRSIPAQARWVAKYIKQHNGPNGQWMGFHGLRDADPKWGDSGYDPNNVIPSNGDARESIFPATRSPVVRVMNNTGNNPVLAHAMTAQPSTTVNGAH